MTHRTKKGAWQLDESDMTQDNCVEGYRIYREVLVILHDRQRTFTTAYGHPNPLLLPIIDWMEKATEAAKKGADIYANKG